jgi:hypothetical protein
MHPIPELSLANCLPHRCKSRRGKRWHIIDPILKFTIGLFLELVPNTPFVQGS